jgi:hypothetical protein
MGRTKLWIGGGGSGLCLRLRSNACDTNRSSGLVVVDGQEQAYVLPMLILPHSILTPDRRFGITEARFVRHILVGE